MKTAAIIEVLTELKERSRQEPVSIGAALAKLENNSFYFSAIILALPFLQPISLGPLSIPAGIALTSLGYQLARGRKVPFLGKRIEGFALSAQNWGRLLRACEILVKVINSVSRERLAILLSGKKCDLLVGSLICVGGLLLLVPLVAVPFNNTFPAVMVVAAAAAGLERDGIMIFVSILFFFVTLAYFASSTAAVVLLCAKAIAVMRDVFN